MTHKVGILALDGVVAYDLAIPCGVFGHAMSDNGEALYIVKVCGETSEVRSSAFAIRPPFGLEATSDVDTLIVAGIEDIDRPVPDAVIAAVLCAWQNGARIASICSGAFVLAACGLLDGHRATTHWAGADALAARYPLVTVDPNVLFVDEGKILTSAGASAGMDMCLYMLRRDHGQAVAAQAARLAVAPLDRDGGQAQFIQRKPPTTAANLAPVLEWMLSNIDKPLMVSEIAAHARMSERTFTRRFREQTGTSPVQWLQVARLRRAQELLEQETATIDQIAFVSGFASSVTFRATFRRLLGITPAAYRKRFNSASSSR